VLCVFTDSGAFEAWRGRHDSALAADWTVRKPKVDEPLIVESARAGARAELAELLQAAERSLQARSFDDFSATATAAGELADRLGDTYAQSQLVQLAPERSTMARSDPPAVVTRGLVGGGETLGPPGRDQAVC
jgi:hypothetical protein